MLYLSIYKLQFKQTLYKCEFLQKLFLMLGYFFVKIEIKIQTRKYNKISVDPFHQISAQRLIYQKHSYALSRNTLKPHVIYDYEL